MTSACEQCGRNRLPQLFPITSYPDYLSTEKSQTKLILSPEPSHSHLQTALPKNTVALLVGSESGFSEEELQSAIRQDFVPVTLGPRILRTETAALAACAILQYQWGDFEINR
jgi:16S rRNA (uracil1498-N3)-methyltransferase